MPETETRSVSRTARRALQVEVESSAELRPWSVRKPKRPKVAGVSEPDLADPVDFDAEIAALSAYEVIEEPDVDESNSESGF